MDRKTFLAIVLCFLIYAGWQKYFIEPHMQQSQSSFTNAAPPSGSEGFSSSNPNGTQVPQSLPRGAAAIPPHHEPVKLPIQTGTGEAILGDSGLFFLDWNLKSYKLGLSPEAAAVNMSSVTREKGDITLAFDDPNLAYLNEVQGSLSSTPQGAQWVYQDHHVKLTREFISSGEQPFVDVRVTAEFKEKAPRYAFISVNAQGYDKDPEAQDRHLVYWADETIERVPLKDQLNLREITTPVRYIGATNRYFVMAVVNQNPTPANGLIQPTGQHAGRVSLVYPVSGNTLSIPFRVYFGPKELELLRQVDPKLDHTVDFGWFTIFAYPLLKVLKWLYHFFQNYGLAIIFLTILLKVVTYPLTYKSMKSMKKMAKLQPKLQKIREKYKDDQEALNREMMSLMKTQGYNPMAGCLPMLIQMPIFFALYRVLYSSIELYHAPFTLWIQDLSSHDPFYVTPVLLSLTMFIQQKLTPNTATDPAQARMMQLMPLIFGAFMLALPAGLTIYMLVNAITSIIQQIILNKKLDAEPAH